MIWTIPQYGSDRSHCVVPFVGGLIPSGMQVMKSHLYNQSAVIPHTATEPPSRRKALPDAIYEVKGYTLEIVLKDIGFSEKQP